MAFPATPLDVIIEMAIGADPDADPTTWSWTDITDYVLTRDGITITRGRQDRFATTAPAQMSLTLNNVGGRFVVRNPAGAYYPLLRRNVPIRVSVDPGSGAVPRFTGFADNLPLANDTSGNDAHVTLKASGLLKRLSRPSAQILSSPRRYIPSTSPIVYWPLEEGPTAGYGAPDVGTGRLVPWTGKHPSGAVATFARWGTGNLGPWLPPTFAFPGATGLNILVGRVDMGGSPTEWAVHFMYAGSTGSQDLTLDINPGYLDNTLAWPQLTLDPANGLLLVTFNGEPETSSSVPGLFDGLGHSIRISAVQSVTKVHWLVHIDGIEAQDDVTSGVMTLPPIFAVALVSTASGGASVGHLAVWDSLPAANALADACLGWPDEPAGWRLERLCLDEFIIPFTSVGGGNFLVQHNRLEDTQHMGAQPYAAFLPIAREAEDVDGGILAEATTGELEYLNGRDRYNRDVDLALDYNQGHVSPPFEPADDESGIVNDVTASRSGGGSDVGRYVDEAHVAAEGRYDEGITVNVATEDDLADQASWRVHVGTVPELRFPRLTLNLARNTGLIDDWLACNLSSRVTIDNPPPELPPDLIDQHIVGYTETLSQFVWKVEANLEPASPYTVGIWEDTTLGRPSTPSVVAQPFDAGTDTGVVVSSTSGRVWVDTTNYASQFPFTVRTGGVVLDVTGIGHAIEDTFARTVANAWGTSTSGHLYTDGGGVAGNFNVTSSRGEHTLSTTAVSRRSTLVAPYPDFDVVVDVATSALAATQSIFGGSTAGADLDNLYQARLEFTTGAGIILGLRKRLAAAESSLDSFTTGLTHVAGTFVRVRFQGLGGALRARAWLATGQEPGSWQVDAFDEDVTSSVLGLRSISAAGNTNTNPVVRYDNLALTNPQRFTVTQTPVNGVQRTVDAGEALDLATPMIAGL